MSGPLRVAVVDDHPLALYGVRSILEAHSRLQVTGCAASPEELWSCVADRQDPPADVFLTDLYLGAGRLSPATIADLASLRPALVMSASTNRTDVLDAVSAGASGFLPKSSPPEDFVEALDTVAGGGFYVSSQLADLLDTGVADAVPGSPLASLAPREREVLTLLAQGFTQRQVATRMGVGLGTVDTYLKRIRRKLGPGNTVALVRRAAAGGFIAATG